MKDAYLMLHSLAQIGKLSDLEDYNGKRRLLDLSALWPYLDLSLGERIAIWTFDP